MLSEGLLRAAEMLNPWDCAGMRGRFVETLAEMDAEIDDSAAMDAALTGRSVDECVDVAWREFARKQREALLDPPPPPAAPEARRFPYDTLDDFDWASEVDSIAELSVRLCGPLLEDDAVHGLSVSGAVELARQHASVAWGRRALELDGALYSVRCLPRGRAGHALRVGEVRRIAVLVRDSSAPKRGRVTELVVARVAIGQSGIDSMQSWGPFGVNMLEVCQFEAPHRRVLGSFRGVVSPNALRILPGDHVVQIAGMLAGVQTAKGAWCGGLELMGARENAEERRRALVAFDAHSLPYAALDYVSASLRLADSLSFVGLLDRLADPFLASGGLPDAFSAHLPALMAMACRVAARADRFGLPAGCGSARDRFVAGRFDALCRSATGAVPGDATATHVDCALKIALDAVAAAVESLRVGVPDPCATAWFLADGASRAEYAAISDAIEAKTSAMVACLFRAGVALTGEVCDVVPPSDPPNPPACPYADEVRRLYAARVPPPDRAPVRRVNDRWGLQLALLGCCASAEAQAKRALGRKEDAITALVMAIIRDGLGAVVTARCGARAFAFGSHSIRKCTACGTGEAHCVESAFWPPRVSLDESRCFDCIAQGRDR